MKKIIFVIATVFILGSWSYSKKKIEKNDKPKVCFTFDDGNTADLPGYSGETWDKMLLAHLKKNKLQAVFFALGKTLDHDKGKQVLERWSKQGHLIGNHTYSHQSYSRPETSFEFFKDDFLKNDAFIRQYSGFVKMFRFPYLKEGDTEQKRDDFRAFMKEQGYRNGYVTIDASDWFVNSRLLKRLKENPKADIEPYREYFLEHIYEHAVYYNDLSLKLTGRQINHALLLHHNLTSALFLDDLIALFKAKGWEVVNASEAYSDEIYTRIPQVMPAGESLIWALAKENGGYENILRYPGEDSKYEEAKMNQLGL